MSIAARRAVSRWSWRMFRREWRQQVLVLALLTAAVAAAVGGVAFAYAVTPSPEARFGRADAIVTLDGSEAAVAADVRALADRFGPVETIPHATLPLPGSVDSVDLRAQAPGGALGGPMLALRRGRYPTGADEVALTDGAAADLRATVGDRVRADARARLVVGLVENPHDLTDEFALVAPASFAGRATVTALVSGDPAAKGMPRLATLVGVEERGGDERSLAAAGALSVAALAMLLVSLLAAAGFVVLAQRRLRQLGLLSAIGAAERHLRLAVVVNGLIVGVAAALAGTAVGLGAWVAGAPALESSAGHRINRFALPWWAVVAVAVLAVVAAAGAAWWPARTMARVPVTAALSGRPAAPRPAHRPALLALALVVAGAAALAAGIDVRRDTGNVPLLLGGLVALVVGMLLAAPLAVRLLGPVASRAPVAVRLALRDLARNTARAGAALAAVSLALGIPAAIVAISAAGVDAADAGNLPDSALLVRSPTDPDSDPPADAVARQAAAVSRIAALVDGSTTALDVPVDPAVDPRQGPPSVMLGTRVNENTVRDAGIPYVLTPALAARYHLPAGGGDPAVDLYTALPQDLVFANTSRKNSPITRVERVDLPRYTSAPSSFVTPAAVRRHGWRTARAGWLIDGSAPVSAAQVAAARDEAAAAGLLVESRDHQGGLATVRLVATAAGALLALGILAMTAGLLRGESAGDLRTLTAVGAGSRSRRTITATTTGALALLGALIGTAGAYAALVAAYADDLSRLTPVPVGPLLALALGVPALAAATAWVAAGRQPATLARTPGVGG